MGLTLQVYVSEEVYGWIMCQVTGSRSKSAVANNILLQAREAGIEYQEPTSTSKGILKRPEPSPQNGSKGALKRPSNTVIKDRS